MSAEDASDHIDDRGIRNAPVEKRLDRDLVRGVQHRRSRAPGLERGVCEPHGRIARLIEREELELSERQKVESRERRWNTIGIRERIEDREIVSYTHLR